MTESPTCVVEFIDGEITRMTTWSATGKPDVDRGIRLAHHAYRSRTGREPPSIKSMHFESEGASQAGGRCGANPLAAGRDYQPHRHEYEPTVDTVGRDT